MADTAIASITLSEELDLRACGPLVGALVAARGGDVVLDGSHVLRVGGQCLQVLLSAALTWDLDGLVLRLDAPSAAFVDALGTAGLEPGRLGAPLAAGTS